MKEDGFCNVENLIVKWIITECITALDDLIENKMNK